MKNVRWYGAFMLLSIMFLGGCGGGSSSDFVGPTLPFPYENGEYITGQPSAEFYVENLGILMTNAFGHHLGGSGYGANLIRWFDNNGTFKYGWDWNWPSKEKLTLFSFSSIVNGYKLNLNPSPDNIKFPKKISEINEFKITFDIENVVENDSIWNTMSMFWLVEDGRPPFSPNKIKAEIMIWFDWDWPGSNNPEYDKEIPTLNDSIHKIGNNYYTITINRNWEETFPGHPFISILLRRFGRTNKINDYNIKEVIDHFVSIGEIKSEWFVTDIEFGNEVASGKGRAKVNHFSFTID